MLYGTGIIGAWTSDFLILIKDLFDQAGLIDRVRRSGLRQNTLTCLAGGHKFRRARISRRSRGDVRQNEHAGPCFRRRPERQQLHPAPRLRPAWGLTGPVDHDAGRFVGSAMEIVRSTSKITAADQPNSRTPFIAAIGPSSRQYATGMMSPYPSVV